MYTKILLFFIFGISFYHVFVFSSTISDFRNCLKKNGIEPADLLVVEKQSDGSGYYNYNRLNYQWNTRLAHVFPLGYFLPTQTQEVQQGVKCGIVLNISLIPKCGGHSYESYSFGSNSSVIVDFRKMNSVIVDPKTSIGTIGPGVLLGEAVEKLWRNGGYGIPVGDFATVGVGGQALGGGVGYFSHKFGLTLDSLVEMEMVDAKGQVHVVSENQNEELFWALRGIGPGYIGIVTQFKFKLFKASNLKIHFVKITYDIQRIRDCLDLWQYWTHWKIKNHPSIYSHLSVEENKILLQSVYIEDGSTQQDQIVNFIDNLKGIFVPNTTLSWDYSVLPYIDFVLATSAPSANNKRMDLATMKNSRNLENPVRFVKMKTFLVKELPDSKTVKNMAEILLQVPKFVGFFSSSEHGAIWNIPANATAYVHRNSLFSIEVTYSQSGSGEEKQVKEWNAWLKKFLKESKCLDSGETYQNYVDSDLNDHVNRYYGSNLPRLIEIKRKWDPDNYFQSHQSIPISNGSFHVNCDWLILCFLVITYNLTSFKLF